jgi:hypothetical protein
MISKLSFASFPVAEKTTEPEPGTPDYDIILVVLIVISIARSFQYKKKYGTFYKPWSSYPEWLRKYLWIFLLGFIGIMALGMSAMYMG